MLIYCWTAAGTDSQQLSLAAVGTWGMQLSLLSLPSLSPILTEPLGGEVIPRSVLLTEFEGVRGSLALEYMLFE